MPVTPLPTKKLEAQVRELQRSYREAAREINATLRDAALTDFQRFRYTELKKQIDAILEGLDRQAVSVTQAVIPPCYKYGADLAAQALRDADVNTRGLNMGNKIHTSGMNAIADQMAQDLLQANGIIQSEAVRILRRTQQMAVEDREINRMIGQGIIKGETRRETSERLTQAIRDRIGYGDGIRLAVPCRDGKTRHYKPEDYAELVARTQTREAVTEGSLRTGQEFGVELFRVSVHEGACTQCLPFQGKIYALGKDPDFPTLERRPPFHPRCAHVLTPVSRDIMEERGELERMAQFSRDPDALVLDGNEYDAVRAGKPIPPRPEPDQRAAQKAKATPKVDTDSMAAKITQIHDDLLLEAEKYQAEETAMWEEWEAATADLTRLSEIPDAYKTEAWGLAIAREKAISKHAAALSQKKMDLRRAAIDEARAAINAKNPCKLPIAKGGMKGSAIKKSRPIILQAVSEFESLVDIAATPGGAGFPNPITFNAVQKKRAFCRVLTQEVVVSKWDGPKTVIHEIGHYLEWENPKIHDAARAFLERRTQGDVEERLRDLTGLNYKATEVCKKDKFINPYIGRIYKKGGGREAVTEVVSMGLQYMYEDPVDFARKDPDHFDLIYAIMSGTL